MRDQRFVETVQRLLELESSRSASVVNLDYRGNGIEPSHFDIDRGATAWVTALVGSEGANWFSSMVRLGASSTAGGWCAYCEPMAEIGVIAFRSDDLHLRARPVLSDLHALPIAAKIVAAGCLAFSKTSLDPQYFASLGLYYSRAHDRGPSVADRHGPESA